MHMPAVTLVTGKIHAKDHFCVITKGRVSVASEERTQLIEAPFIYTSKLGTKRALYAHVDSIWVTFHPADTQDLEELERNLIVEHYDQLESKEVKKLCHG
jgi:hypothetical protein